MKPDYGLKLHKDGILKATNLNFYDFPLSDLTILSQGQYSSMSNTIVDGIEYAFSLDFNQEQLEEILSSSKSSSVQIIKDELNVDSTSPRAIDFEDKIIIDIIAKLGDMEVNQNESYVPFILQNIMY